MQCTITRGQFVQLKKMGLFDEEVLKKCEFRERKGDYKNKSTGEDIMRTTIILPTYEVTIPAKEYLEKVSGSVAEANKEQPEEAEAEGDNSYPE